MQRFARIELDAEGVPDATMLLKFRRLLETHDLCRALFAAINADLAAPGLLLREGTLVDATLIAADRDSKLVHTVVVTAANVADISQTGQLLDGNETQVHADAGYTGAEKRPEIAALARPIDWQIACKRGLIKALAEGAQKEAIKVVEHTKAAVRVRRTSLPPREESVRTPQDAVSRTGQEHPPTPHALRFGQRGDRRPSGRGVSPQGEKPAPPTPPPVSSRRDRSRFLLAHGADRPPKPPAALYSALP